MHHFDGAASQAESHGPEGGLAGPVCYLVEGRSGGERHQYQSRMYYLRCWDCAYNAYCMTPSFFSWLGSGTSRRGLPVTLSGGAFVVDCVWRADAGFGDDEDMKAAGIVVRKGIIAVEGLALEMLAFSGKEIVALAIAWKGVPRRASNAVDLKDEIVMVRSGRMKDKDLRWRRETKLRNNIEGEVEAGDVIDFRLELIGPPSALQ